MKQEIEYTREQYRTLEKARRLIDYVGALDSGKVTDYGIGNGEYPLDPEQVWIIGDWWERDENGNLCESRLGEVLENIGAMVVFYDEWIACDECHRIYRTAPDSYFWQSSLVYLGDAYVCIDCLEWEWIEQDYVNDPDRALTRDLYLAMDLEGKGFVELTPRETRHFPNGNTREEIVPYESGWHQGMDDNPREIYDSLSEDWDEIVFVVSETSQFYIRFRVFGRVWEQEEGKG